MRVYVCVFCFFRLFLCVVLLYVFVYIVLCVFVFFVCGRVGGLVFGEYFVVFVF